ncbi:MAG: hypothetical protein OSB26_17730 [Woeseiaceae bacterium]|nr:hypothetical protein [Woeseiaceae bacterium]
MKLAQETLTQHNLSLRETNPLSFVIAGTQTSKLRLCEERSDEGKGNRFGDQSERDGESG